ncbi:MAG: NERD domain-containing protein [Rhodospirillaceae bacterium]|nr:NERD domain-containing protein [Rhodospirillaceae bacterium]
MAYIVPSDISKLSLKGCHQPELATLSRLKRELSSDYTVFHSVHWTREYKGNTAYGEADFVILNRAGEVLIIEQKNGVLVESSSGLVKRYNDGESDPFFQVRRSVDKIREKFSQVHRRKQRLNLDYLVYLPNYKVHSVNSVGVDISRLVDASSDDRLASKIHEILGPGENAGEWRVRVEDFFRQSFDIFPDIHAHLHANEKNFTRLSGGLAATLSSIEMHPLRLRVKGAPGCGKTVIAHRFFERAIKEGRKPLLVCFNRSLAEKIRACCSQGGMVETWHGLCHKFIESQGTGLDFSLVGEDPEFWNKVQDQVVAAAIPDDWLFDTIIVDEGQDFKQEWADILRLFARGDADILWLEDHDQAIRHNEPVTLDEFIGFRTRANHRSPENIARFILKSLPFEFEAANDLPGQGVQVHPYDSPKDQPKIVARSISRLVSRGFRVEDIVVVSLKGIRNTGLSQSKRIGNYTLKQFDNTYDIFGNQNFTAGQVQLESIYRFKGQQAPAIIVIDVETRNDDVALTERLLYAVFSRATVCLEVLVRADDPFSARLLHAAGQERFR